MCGGEAACSRGRRRRARRGSSLEEKSERVDWQGGVRHRTDQIGVEEENVLVRFFRSRRRRPHSAAVAIWHSLCLRHGELCGLLNL
jgi:hypothetical protein